MKRVHELAKERGITSKEAFEVLRDAGLDVKVAASRVEEAEAARVFGSGPRAAAAVKTAANTAKAKPAAKSKNGGAKPEGKAQTGAAGAQQRMSLRDFIAWVEAEQPEQLSVVEVPRVWPPPWFTRNGSGKRARIRLPVGEQKYERMQREEYWHWVDHWTMGPPR